MIMTATMNPFLATFYR